MSWLDALLKFAKKVLPTEISVSLIRLDRPTFNIVNGGKVGSVGSHGKVSVKKITKGDRIPIDVSRLSKDERLQLQKDLAAALDADQTFLLEHTPDSIREIRASQEDAVNRDILAALQPFLSTNDFAALRASTVLRYMQKSGRDVFKQKGDIVHKFGDRGAKIANLCSAGYFDECAKQLRAFQASPDFNADEYRRKLGDFITHSAFALFVRQDWARAQTRKEIIAKISLNAGYGINQVVLHAIGDENIDKVRQIVDALIKKFPEINKVSDDWVAGEVRVRLEFPSKIAKQLR